MIISGAALFVLPGSFETVLAGLHRYPEVTFHARSEAGDEIVVTIEADNTHHLEFLCASIKEGIPEVVDISHVYMNMEDEVEEMLKRRPD